MRGLDRGVSEWLMTNGEMTLPITGPATPPDPEGMRNPLRVAQQTGYTRNRKSVNSRRKHTPCKAVQLANSRKTRRIPG